MKRQPAKKTSKSTRTSRSEPSDEIPRDFDFSGGVRGKHAKAHAEGTNRVLLDPDVAAVFSDSRSVNTALRAIIPIVGLCLGQRRERLSAGK